MPQEFGHLLHPVELPTLPENPVVSVLLANFNYAEYIGQAIESVLAQSYSNFELIVCDDGSTDRSRDVISRYVARESRIRLLCQANSGQAAALNAAYAESHGEIICLMDADDRFLPKKLETVIKVFRAHPNSGFLAHRLFQIDKQGRRFGGVAPPRDPPSGWHGELVLRTGDPPPGLVPTSGLCMRRRVADSICPLPLSLRLCADSAVCSLAPLTTRLIGLPVPLAEYRSHGRNGFAVFKVNADDLRLRLELYNACWSAQRGYLLSVHPRLAEACPSVEKRLGFQAVDYVRARLSRDATTTSAYRRFVQNPRFSSSPLPLRCFWVASILLPLPLFRRVVDWVWGHGGQGSLKRLVWQVLRFFHARQEQYG